MEKQDPKKYKDTTSNDEYLKSKVQGGIIPPITVLDK